MSILVPGVRIREILSVGSLGDISDWLFMG